MAVLMVVVPSVVGNHRLLVGTRRVGLVGLAIGFHAMARIGKL